MYGGQSLRDNGCLLIGPPPGYPPLRARTHIPAHPRIHTCAPTRVRDSPSPRLERSTPFTKSPARKIPPVHSRAVHRLRAAPTRSTRVSARLNIGQRSASDWRAVHRIGQRVYIMSIIRRNGLQAPDMIGIKGCYWQGVNQGGAWSRV